MQGPGIIPDKEIGPLDQSRGIEYVRRRDKHYPFCSSECVLQGLQLICFPVTAQEYDIIGELSENLHGERAELSQGPGTEFPSGKRMHNHIPAFQTQQAVACHAAVIGFPPGEVDKGVTRNADPDGLEDFPGTVMYVLTGERHIRPAGEPDGLNGCNAEEGGQ